MISGSMYVYTDKKKDTNSSLENYLKYKLNGGNLRELLVRLPSKL